MPLDLTEIVGWRTANTDEIPRGATTVANTARKAGWKVSTSFARLPWIDADGEEKATPSDGDAPDAALVEVVMVHGRRGSSKFRASWHCKLWTKNGENRTFSFAGAAMWPAVEGEVIASKAKKDRHPEHLGDKTIGGLKNSKTLTDYLKEN